jgi:FkbM family methyltransferase
MTAAFAHELSKEDTIRAYEPHPATFTYLERNTEGMRATLSGMEGPTLISKNKALSNVAGTLTLFIPGEEYTRSWASLEKNRAGEGVKEVEVETATLDDEIRESIQVLKIDVEGHEYKVLEGARV